MTDPITSAANPLVRRIRRLLSERRFRAREGVFVVEGAQPVWRAVESGRAIEQLVVSWPLLRPPAAHAMVRDFEDAGGQVSVLSAELFERLSERDGPSGVMAIVSASVPKLASLDVAPDATFVALEHVGNPGNLGTIIRTVDAAGGAGVVLIGNGADPFDPAAVKASMGSVFAVPVVRAASIEAFFAWAHGRGVQVAALSGSASDSHWTAQFQTPTALLFGAEGPGLTREAVERSDSVLRIPMTGTAESLNLSIAVAVALYEARREQLSGH